MDGEISTRRDVPDIFVASDPDRPDSLVSSRVPTPSGQNRPFPTRVETWCGAAAGGTTVAPWQPAPMDKHELQEVSRHPPAAVSHRSRAATLRPTFPSSGKRRRRISGSASPPPRARSSRPVTATGRSASSRSRSRSPMAWRSRNSGTTSWPRMSASSRAATRSTRSSCNPTTQSALQPHGQLRGDHRHGATDARYGEDAFDQILCRLSAAAGRQLAGGRGGL